MTTIGREDVLRALAPLDRDNPPLRAEMISGLSIGKDGTVRLIVDIGDPGQAETMEPLRQKAESLLQALPGVKGASVLLTAEKTSQKAPSPDHSASSVPQRPEAGNGASAIKHIIAVASGKGGVGKSTVAVNLALALQQSGLKTGLLDVDIYGPSLPLMLGLSGKPNSPDGRTLTPLTGHGLKTMSIGFMVPEEQPVIWRGPMVMGAVRQMLNDVDWGPLDVLVLDMPPGTGDAPLTIAQITRLSGAVIISTPQDIALIDARRALAMFRKMQVPVLGLVENMSHFTCPHCGEHTAIFGHGGAKREAVRLGCDLLGEIPLHLDIREGSDAGQPVTLAQPNSPHAKAFTDIAAKVRKKLCA